MTTVLIAGCGYVGRSLGERLAESGHRVLGLRRDAEKLPPSIEPLRADLSDPETLDVLPDDVEQVVYAASPGERSDEAYARTYVAGPENLLRTLQRRGAPVRRFVLTTSTAVYGQSNGETVDETSPTEPESFSGKRLLEGERPVADGPYPAVAIRLAGIYGPGRTALLRRVRAGEAKCPAEPRPGNRIHRDDCAGAIAHLLALEAPDPIYVGVDRDPADLCEVMCFVADRLGVPRPPRAAAGEDDRSLRRGRSNKRCDGERLLASGYRLAYPSYRDGYPPLIEELLRDRP